MQTKRMFVQFIHPGIEHSSSTGVAWNRGGHRRKFMLSSGYAADMIDAAPTAAELVFWGEWEPQSKIVQIFATPQKHNPKTLFKPYYSKQSNYTNLQNTDPFIFDGPFLYSCCQQTKPGYTSQMSHLDKGSVILFGSCLGRQFVLDTVFVVKDYIDYQPQKAMAELKRHVPRVFIETVLNTFDAEVCRNSLTLQNCVPSAPPSDFKEFLNRLYIGVTHNERDQFGGMFSYVPCNTRTSALTGFARPTIKIDKNLSNCITPQLSQGRKQTELADIKAIAIPWHSVTEQVLAQGLLLGTHFEAPRRYG